MSNNKDCFFKAFILLLYIGLIRVCLYQKKGLAYLFKIGPRSSIPYAWVHYSVGLPQEDKLQSLLGEI